MAEPTRIRALCRDGGTDVHVLMIHPMETGLRRDESGQFVLAHYITEVRIVLAGRMVLQARLGRGVSSDPLLHFRLRGGAPGERLSVSWTDSHGEQRTDDALIQPA